MGESEEEESEIKYPATLDIIRWDGKEYQVVASKQTKNPEKDLFVLKDLNSNKFLRVKGATFQPHTQEPGEGDMYLRDEGVKSTGELLGGSIDEGEDDPNDTD